MINKKVNDVNISKCKFTYLNNDNEVWFDNTVRCKDIMLEWLESEN